MSKKDAQPKLSFGETLRTGWKPYRRLYSYAMPYKWRHVVGIAFGLAFGLVNAALALVVFQVSNFVFPGGGPRGRRRSWPIANC